MAAAGSGPEIGATRLLERERELDVLDHALAGALAGAFGVVIIEGPAGIGKSRLVAEARTHAIERGLLVLSARGGELERDFPFGIVRQLFEPRLADEVVRERVLVGAAREAAAIFGLTEAPREDASAAGSFDALHALYWLTVNMSGEAPLLLAIDDLHWSDRASLRFLAYVLRRLDGLPVLVVGTVRPLEQGVDDALLAELMSDPDVQLLSPRPLSAGAAVALVRERLGDGVDRAFGEACHASTHGNPLFLSELLKALASERVAPDAAHVEAVAELGPRAASRAVLLRLGRLSPAAVKIARSLAVLGDGAELTVVGAHAELEAAALASAAAELVRAEIVRSDPPLGFVHPLVQAAVYRDLAPGQRELSHERAARILVTLDAKAEQVAAHVLEMPRSGEDWVVDVLRAAACAAFAKGAPDAAIASLQRAMAEPLPPDLRAELLFELGRAQALTSLPDSAETLRGAFENARDPALRGHAADWLACSLIFLEASDEAADIARRTIVELPLSSTTWVVSSRRASSSRSSSEHTTTASGSTAFAAIGRSTQNAGRAPRCSERSQPGNGPRARARLTRSSRWRARLSWTRRSSRPTPAIWLLRQCSRWHLPMSTTQWSCGTPSARRRTGAASSSHSLLVNYGVGTRNSCAARSRRRRPTFERDWPRPRSGASRRSNRGQRPSSPSCSSSAGPSRKLARSSTPQHRPGPARTWRSSWIARRCAYCSPRDARTTRSRTPTSSSGKRRGGVTPATCRGVRRRPRPSTLSTAGRKQSGSRPRNFRSPGRGDRRARSDAPCAFSGRSNGKTGSSISRRRAPCSSTPPPVSSWRRLLPRSARRSAVPCSRPKRVSRYAKRSSSQRFAAPRHSSNVPAPSSTRPAPDLERRRSAEPAR